MQKNIYEKNYFHQWHISNHLGHGIKIKGGNIALSFESHDGFLSPFDADGLEGLCKTCHLSSNCKFVFVSACNSEEIGNAFISAGIPHVVCSTREDAITEGESNYFTEHFYKSLFNGCSVKDSFDQARSFLEAEKRRTTHLLLLPRDCPEQHSEIIFSESMEGQPTNETRTSPLPKLKLLTSPFIGRMGELYTISELFFKQNCRHVIIEGERGIGKTELAQKYAEFVADRDIFEKIFFVDFSATVSDFKEADTGADECQVIIDEIGFAVDGSRLPNRKLSELIALLASQVQSTQKVLIVLDGCCHMAKVEETSTERGFDSVDAVVVRTDDSLFPENMKDGFAAMSLGSISAVAVPCVQAGPPKTGTAFTQVIDW